MEKIVPELKRRGIRVAVVKHDAHDFEIDKEGKDSFRITRSGTDITGLVSKDRAVIMENRPRRLEQIFGMISDVDIILTEGYKTGIWPKIMLHRSATGHDYPLEPYKCLAVISDVPVPDAPRQFSFEDIAGMADFLISRIRHGHSGKNPLHRVPFLAGVSDRTIQGLWKDGRLEEVPRNMPVIEMKQPPQYIYIQISGTSSVYNLDLDGNRKVIFIFGPGVILNESVIEKHSPSLFCSTMEKSKILAIPLSRFNHWMKEDYRLVRAVLDMQEWKMRRMARQLKNTVSRLSIERKLAAKLWKLGHDYGEKKGEETEVPLVISVTFLADMLGVPRETASRACKTLGSYGLIRMDKKRITISGMDRLYHFYRYGRGDEDPAEN